MSALDDLRTDNLILLLIGSTPLPNYIAAQLLARDLQAFLNRVSRLRLVASIVILFNAAYIQEAANKWQASGYDIGNDLLAHIFPTSTARLNFLGDHSFRDEPTLANWIS